MHNLTQLQELHLANQKLPHGHHLEIEASSLRCLVSLHTLNIENSRLNMIAPLCLIEQLRNLQAGKNELDSFEVSKRLHIPIMRMNKAKILIVIMHTLYYVYTSLTYTIYANNMYTYVYTFISFQMYYTFKKCNCQQFKCTGSGIFPRELSFNHFP